MSAGEQLPEARAQNPPGQGVDHARVAPPAVQPTTGSGAAAPALQRAMEALVKAQDYLNTAADQSRGENAKVIVGISQTLRRLQREVSDVIHNVGRK